MILSLSSHLKRNKVLNISKLLLTNQQWKRHQSCFEVVIAGGGSGGISVAARLARKLGKNKVAVIEPADKHYYQPIWTLVGAGAKSLSTSGRGMKDVMPNGVTWIQNKVSSFDPKNNSVSLDNSEQITYKYLVVALGIKLRFDKIKGLPEAFSTPGVCSNYSVDTVESTFKSLQNFQEGNAIFTFPPPPLKCPGAPQKIMYLADEYFRKTGKREKANIMFNSAGPSIFAVQKYAKSLLKVVERKNITLNFGQQLIEVKPDCQEAVFQQGSDPDDLITYPYQMLHITPPMSPHDCLKDSELTDASGFVDVNKHTTQHKTFKNVFSLGDCSNIPTSKTAAAIASQNAVLVENMLKERSGGKVEEKYDGYTSCPLITGYKSCILAEFDFDLSPLETFPINQGKERRSMYHLKADMMPFIYWNQMLKGRWSGPKVYRKMMHLGLSK